MLTELLFVIVLYAAICNGESTVDDECSPPVPCCPMVLCQLLGIIIRICSKRFLPDKSSINVVERRSVPGGYFSEL